jgi:hypothetical protein
MARVMISEYWDHGKKKAIRTYSLHDTIYPPGLMELNGDKYIMPGWYKLDKHEHDIKLEDIKHVMPKFLKRDNNLNIDSNKEYKVMSSKGDKEYVVKSDSTGSLSCECPGYGFRRRCRHIDQVTKSLI